MATALLALCLSAGPVTAAPETAGESRQVEPWERILLENPEDARSVRGYFRSLSAIPVDGPLWSGHPLVGKYAEAGPDNMARLLAFLDADFPHNHFVLWAVRQLAGREHKDLLLRAVAENEELMPVVLRFGWQREIRDLIERRLRLAAMRPADPLNRVWIEAAVSLEDPDLHQILLNLFRQSQAPERMMASLRQLPPELLRPAVEDVWLNAARRGESGRRAFAPVAAEWGVPGAFEELFAMLREPPEKLMRHPGIHTGPEERRENLRVLITRISEASPGLTVGELLSWHEVNQGEFFYDASRRLWSVREPVIPRSWTSRDGRTLEAVLVGARGPHVTVRREDGRVIVLHMDNLSPADREYVRRQTR